MIGVSVPAVALWKAKVADEQALDTGTKQEGSLFSIETFALKLSSGVGALIAGLALDIIGLNTGQLPSEVGLQPLVGLALTMLLGVCPFLVFGWQVAKKICGTDNLTD